LPATTFKNYQIEIEYDGTDFFGWQVQPQKRTIQGELQSALAIIYQNEILIAGSGRTDAGVHACGQSACFQAPPSIPIENLIKAINANLPSDIVVRTCKERPLEFHPRFDAKYKIYRYRFLIGNQRSALERNFLYHFKGKVDPKKIFEACKILEGTHDFKAFSCLRGDESGNEDTVRTIYEIRIDNSRENIFDLYFKGNGFLYKMVRMLTGSIIHYASHESNAIVLQDLLDKGERSSAGPAAPSCGLTLMEVGY
jgi:tRNA pseudouridine38-40 synthase